MKNELFLVPLVQSVTDKSFKWTETIFDLVIIIDISRYYANYWVMLRTDYFLLETGRDIKQEVAQEQDV